MSFGLIVRDSAGVESFNSDNFSLKVIALLEWTPTGLNPSLSIPNFDSTKGVAWLQNKAVGGAMFYQYTVSGSIVTLAGNFSTNTNTYLVFAVHYL